MIRTELAAAVQRRAELIAEVVSRHTGSETVTEMRGPCEYSGWCGCTCIPCRVGTKHNCGHRRDCHKACRSL